MKEKTVVKVPCELEVKVRNDEPRLVIHLPNNHHYDVPIDKKLFADLVIFLINEEVIEE